MRTKTSDKIFISFCGLLLISILLFVAIILNDKKLSALDRNLHEIADKVGAVKTITINCELPEIKIKKIPQGSFDGINWFDIDDMKVIYRISYYREKIISEYVNND